MLTVLIVIHYFGDFFLKIDSLRNGISFLSVTHARRKHILQLMRSTLIGANWWCILFKFNNWHMHVYIYIYIYVCIYISLCEFVTVKTTWDSHLMGVKMHIFNTWNTFSFNKLVLATSHSGKVIPHT